MRQSPRSSDRSSRSIHGGAAAAGVWAAAVPGWSGMAEKFCSGDDVTDDEEPSVSCCWIISLASATCCRLSMLSSAFACFGCVLQILSISRRKAASFALSRFVRPGRRVGKEKDLYGSRYGTMTRAQTHLRLLFFCGA